MEESAMQHVDGAQQLFASIAAMMREQQQQQQPIPAQQPEMREFRAEGISMPKFGGKKDEDVADFMFSAKLYFESKNIPYGANSPQQRPLSLLVVSLHGPVAAWYRMCRMRATPCTLPRIWRSCFLMSSRPDGQEHLRDQLLKLKQSNFSCLEVYVSAFRGIICKVEDMSDIDKVMHFQKGLVTEIKQNQASSVPNYHGDYLFCTTLRSNTSRCIEKSRTHPAEYNLYSCGRPDADGNRSFQRLVEGEQSEDVGVERVQFNMVSVDTSMTSPKELLRFDGLMNGQPIRILIDSGADKNIVRPDLARNGIAATKVNAERFGGTMTPARVARRCCETVSFGGNSFVDVFNLIIDWHSGTLHFNKWRLVMDGRELYNTPRSCSMYPAQLHVRDIWQHDPTMTKESAGQQTASLAYFHVPLSSAVVTPAQHPRDRAVGSALYTVSADEFGTKLQADAYLEVYNVTLKTTPQRKSVPPQFQVIITEFADGFPNELPPELPPSRSIEHEVILMPGAKPSNRGPFRLSKVEQEA
ncbi:unnamed protein product [Phytophthora fragariaefolia]|uniref:Unnamed protein product n=1 Tax=Phytophthora fragariaefolia TaxID=1490495 RepID=A0A9W6Y409_9STRA|nr:unnamed protein product [Phytophthora fragariaefolia]